MSPLLFSVSSLLLALRDRPESSAREGGGHGVNWSRFLLLSRWYFYLSCRYYHPWSGFLDLLESSAGGAVVCILDCPRARLEGPSYVSWI